MDATMDCMFSNKKNKNVNAILNILEEISYSIDKEFDTEKCDIVFSELYNVFISKHIENHFSIEMLGFINNFIFNEEQIVNYKLIIQNLDYFIMSSEVKLDTLEMEELINKINLEISIKSDKEKIFCYATNAV